MYFAPGACSLAPHIVLEWIGAPFEAVKVAFGSQQLRDLNPAGSVPVLREDHGWTLTQAGAILDHLAQKHPEAQLSGGDSLRDKAEAHRWSAFFTSDMHAAFWPIFGPGKYTTDTTDAAKQSVIEAGQDLVRTRLALLNRHLEGRDWVLGSRSVIDAYAFPMLRWAIKMLPDGLKGYANVQALHDRIAADPAVEKVLAREAGA